MPDSDYPIKVLVIDDLADNRTLVRLDLEDEIENIQIIEAANGREGLAKMENDIFSLVICDLMMPGISGIEVLEKSRKFEGQFEVPFIFLSANKQKDAAEQVLKAGAIDFITKPYDLYEMINKVKNLSRIQHLNRQLFLSQKKLQQNNQMLHNLNKDKDEVLRIVSHDMRNPLSNILGLASLIKTEGVEDEEELIHMADMIEKSSGSLLHLVNSLLDVARIESGRIQVDITQVDVNNLIKASAGNFDFLARRKNIKLNFDLLKGGITAYLDGPKMDQVIGNLLSNAIKFTDSGGEVSLTTRFMGANGQKKVLEVSISDTGMGIPEEILSGVFEQFGPHQRPGTRQEKGTGLGLSIVKRFVELQNGEITIESLPGEGTTFYIRFGEDVLRENKRYEEKKALNT
ncbi:MAG: hybrid sensor histidine kinase/response regulator [Balneolales bacterium]